jgi:hypothetical protein
MMRWSWSFLPGYHRKPDVASTTNVIVRICSASNPVSPSQAASRALALSTHADPELPGTVQVPGERRPPFVTGHSATILP